MFNLCSGKVIPLKKAPPRYFDLANLFSSFITRYFWAFVYLTRLLVIMTVDSTLAQPFLWLHMHDACCDHLVRLCILIELLLLNVIFN